MNNRVIRSLLVSSAALIFFMQHLSALFGATAAIIFTLTVNSAVWEALGCATENSMKNKFTSNGSYFR